MGVSLSIYKGHIIHASVETYLCEWFYYSSLDMVFSWESMALDSRGGGGGYSALNIPGCVSMIVMDLGLFLAPIE